MSIGEQLRDQLAVAMRRRDTAVVAAIRSAMSAIANAQAVPTVDPSRTTAESEHFAGSTAGLGAAEAQRLTLTEQQQRSILAGEVAQLLEHVHRLDRLCRRDEADGVRRAVQTLQAVMDQSATPTVSDTP
ncbi:MAG: hypothetical protein R2687_03755 [Candidatus Nanopelagicales bacterium]